MEHTWQLDHLPQLELSNLEGGDVVLCSSFRNGEPNLAELEAERYGLGILWARNKDNRADKGRCTVSDLMLVCSSEKECTALAELSQG